jgi:Na+/H+-dicarboxylate symporter
LKLRFSTLRALGIYGLTVVFLGLFIMAFVFYPTFVDFFAKVNPIKFFKAMRLLNC